MDEKHDILKLQEDLEKIFKWSLDWQMLFNFDKCSVLHMGRNNQGAEYQFGNTILKHSNQERDLGVIIHHSGKSSQQCALAVKKANAVLGMIRGILPIKVEKL